MTLKVPCSLFPRKENLRDKTLEVLGTDDGGGGRDHHSDGEFKLSITHHLKFALTVWLSDGFKMCAHCMGAIIIYKAA